MYIYQFANCCSNAIMDLEINAIRRINLELLIKESGLGKGKFADKIDTAPAYLSQIMSTKTNRDLGRELARRIERVFCKPRGWMDSLHEQVNNTAPAPDKVALKAVPSANHKDQADAALKPSKTADNYFDGMDFVILMCNLCDDLIDEGLFPDNRESRRSLYKQADDLVERYENNITIERLEVLLRSINNTTRIKMLK